MTKDNISIKSITVGGKQVYNGAHSNIVLTNKGEVIINTTIGKDNPQPLIIEFTPDNSDKIIEDEVIRTN